MKKLLSLLLPTISVLAFSGPAVAAPTRYEAEDATISQGLVESNHTGFTGTGFVNLDNVTGSYAEFSLTIPTAGSYRLTLRYANGTTVNRPMSVNGTTVNFPGTGAWTTWQTASLVLSLPAGTTAVRATSSTANGGPNLDHLDAEATTGGGAIVVSSLAALQTAINNATAGARIELVNGTYSAGSPIVVRTPGITVAAQNVGGATISGSAGFQFTAGDVHVTGFRLTHSARISLNQNRIHLSRNVIQLNTDGNWVTVTGADVEVDHNTFQNKSTEGVFLQISGPGASDMAQRTWVHHNYFFNHTFGGDNGGESIRDGYSYRNLSSAFGTIEYNLFEQANGDSEAISVKSSDNTIRYNTLRNSRGWIVLRHGNRNRVEGNIGLGSGIRFYDNDHVIVNNVVQNSYVIAGSGTIIDDTTGSTAHARPDRALVAFNTITGSGVLLDIGAGNTYGPNDCTFANNILRGSGTAALVDVSKGTNLHWSGNIIWQGAGGDMPSSGYRSVNPGLVSDAGGLQRLGGASSPAVDTATGSYPSVTLDLDLQTRSGAKDVGADEFTAGGAQRRPLTTADVGPSAP